MSYVTWANWADGWNDTTANWASQTYTGDATLGSSLGASDVGNTIYSGSATLANTLGGLYSEDKDSPVYPNYQNQLGFQSSSVHQAVGNATLAALNNITESNNLSVVGSISLDATSDITESNTFTTSGSASLSSTMDESGFGGFSFTGNGTLSSTMDATTSASQAFASAASLGMDTAIVSSSGAIFLSSADFDVTQTFTESNNVKFVSAAELTQLLLDEVNTEDLDLNDFSVTLPSNYGIIASSNVIYLSSASLAVVSNTINNVNYPEAVSLDISSSTTSTSGFLWVIVDEDDSTTWTTDIEGGT